MKRKGGEKGMEHRYHPSTQHPTGSTDLSTLASSDVIESKRHGSLGLEETDGLIIDFETILEIPGQLLRIRGSDTQTDLSGKRKRDQG